VAVAVRRTQSHTDTHSVGFPWTRDRPVAEVCTCTAHNIRTQQTSTAPVDFKPAVA